MENKPPNYFNSTDLSIASQIYSHKPPLFCILQKNLSTALVWITQFTSNTEMYSNLLPDLCMRRSVFT